MNKESRITRITNNMNKESRITIIQSNKKYSANIQKSNADEMQTYLNSYYTGRS